MSTLLFFPVFALYLIGLSGAVPSYRDSGDLIASIQTLGIAHPPGYALYVLIGKLFITVLPFGNVAYRVNVLSAVCAGGAALFLYKALSRLPCVSSVTAFAVSALYAVSPAMIALARVAEMYTAVALIAAAILWCFVSDHPNRNALAALLLGLGLSIHPTLIFLIPLFFVCRGAGFNRFSLLCFMLGLLVLLYLPIRAAQHPLLNWGDPSHWRNFWRVVTRADYGGLKLHPEQSTFSCSSMSILEQLRFFGKAAIQEWGWAAIVIGLSGIFISLKDRDQRRFALGLLASWVLSGPAFFVLSNLPIHEATSSAILQPYLLLAGLLWAPFLAIGLSALSIKRIRPLAPLLVIALFVTRSWAWASDRNDFFSYDYARNMLRSLPQGAVLYDPDDTTHFSIQVLQTVENRRPDIVLLNFFRTRWGYEQLKRQVPDLLPPVPIESGQELQRILWTYSAEKRPFFAELPQKLEPLPYHAQGLVYAAQVGPAVSPTALSMERAESLLDLYVQRGDFVTVHHPDFFTRHLLGYYAAAHCNLGLEYANAKEWDKAVSHYQAALAIDPELTAAYNDWGIVAFEHQDYPKAAELFNKGLALDPGNENLRKNAELALQKMRKLI